WGDFYIRPWMKNCTCMSPKLIASAGHAKTSPVENLGAIGPCSECLSVNTSNVVGSRCEKGVSSPKGQWFRGENPDVETSAAFFRSKRRPQLPCVFYVW